MRDERGYTVLEMLAALFIIVIMGALIAPGLGQLMRRGKVASSVAAVSGVLRTARALAITTNDVYHVRTHVVAGEHYWVSLVWLSDESERYSASEPAWVPGSYETVESGRLQEGTELNLASSSFVFFWPDGTASGGVSFIVQAKDPDARDRAWKVRVRASGIVEELPVEELP